MVKRGVYIVSHPDEEGVRVGCPARAMAPCGCSIFLGQRTDTSEWTTITVPCCAAHLELATRAHAQHLGEVEGQLHPNLPVLDRIDQLINEAYEEEFGGS